jgi:hypothetical protein
LRAIGLLAVSLSVLVAAGPSFAGRGDDAAPRALQGTGAAAAGAAVAAHLERLIDARFAAVDSLAPLPAADAVAVEAINARLAALTEIDVFVEQTMAGLLGAAPTGEAQAMIERQFQPTVSRYEHRMAAAMAQLLDHPTVSSEGWFKAARFGRTAELNAARIVAATAAQTLSPRVRARVEGLASTGEAAPEVLQLLAQAEMQLAR